MTGADQSSVRLAGRMGGHHEGRAVGIIGSCLGFLRYRRRIVDHGIGHGRFLVKTDLAAVGIVTGADKVPLARKQPLTRGHAGNHALAVPERQTQTALVVDP